MEIYIPGASDKKMDIHNPVTIELSIGPLNGERREITAQVPKGMKADLFMEALQELFPGICGIEIRLRLNQALNEEVLKGGLMEGDKLGLITNDPIELDLR